MTEHFFFNLIGDLNEVSQNVFNSLGIKESILEGESSNVLGGYYYSSIFLFIEIRIELNSYDYDDMFQFMLSLRSTKQLEEKCNIELIANFKEIFLITLPKALNTVIAYEYARSKIKIIH